MHQRDRELRVVSVELEPERRPLHDQRVGSIDAACTGTPQPWSIEVFPINATKFSGGKAVSVTFVFACGNFSCGEDFEERTVRLRGKNVPGA